ncbi:hypothetical protein O181_054713, partial [Austropuccinia psidii MF-1]|nr:hypothetical protein [Austropuccinia psidii MF-1]
ISHLTSDPYTPEQNPFAKRSNCTTVSKSRRLLKDSGLGKSYWAEAANTAVYLENLTPNKAINFQTPYFKWFERHPSLKNLHPFGCEATSLILPSPSKFSQKGELGIFIGYGEGHGTYWILNLETGNVKISPHVKFNDNIFPALSYPDSNKTDTFTISDNLYLPAINPNVKTSNIILGENTENQTDLPKFKGYIWTNEPINKTKEIVGEVGDPRNILDTSRQPKHSASFSELSLLDPKNYKQAINSVESKNWEQAISQELQNMAKHSVWSPCNEPNNCKPLTTTWVFKQNTDEDGNLTKFKARLCVPGFNQREGIDYNKVFSPTVRLTSLQLLLTLCSRSKFIVEKMDVRCAFLNGTPDKPLYIYRPNGYKENENCNIFKLNCSFYGLKQSLQRCASKNWIVSMQH